MHLNFHANKFEFLRKMNFSQNLLIFRLFEFSSTSGFLYVPQLEDFLNFHTHEFFWIFDEFFWIFVAKRISRFSYQVFLNFPKLEIFSQYLLSVIFWPFMLMIFWIFNIPGSISKFEYFWIFPNTSFSWIFIHLKFSES